MKKFLALLLAVVMLLSLAACGDSSKDDDDDKKDKAEDTKAGYYVLESMSEGDETLTAEDLEEYGMEVTMTLYEDGTGVLSMYGEDVEAEWDEDSITVDGDEAELKFSGKKATITIEESSMVFVKSGKAPASSSDNKDKDDDQPAKDNTDIESDSPEDAIVGTWVAEIDCSDLMNDMMAESMGEDIADYMDFDGVILEVTMTFTEDGECSMIFTDDALDAYADDVTECLLDGLFEYMDDLLAEDGTPLEEFLEESDMTFEELLEESGVDMGDLTDELTAGFEDSTFDYSIDGDELTIDEDVHEFELDGDDLTIYAPDGSDDVLAGYLFPMYLERAN